MTREDIPDGLRLNDGAGWNQTSADWQRFLAASPDGCFVAEREGRVVGTAATIVYEDRLAWIGMVLVEPRERGRGIGTALLQRAVEHLDARGIPSVKLDATPQGKPIYERMGFESEYGIERWLLDRGEGELPSAGSIPGPAEAGQVDHLELEAALRLDREVFGADRSALLRSLAEAAPEFHQVAMRGTEVAGCTFGRRGLRADHLVPWIARDARVASALLDGFLARSARARLFIDRVLPSRWTGALLEARGFRFSRPLTRMFRGGNGSAGRPELQCAVLGPEFG